MGHVRGAPNVTVIHDLTEVADQEYETLLREEKTVELSRIDLLTRAYRDILIFPGTYNLAKVCETLPVNARLHLDVAYDVDDPGILAGLPQEFRPS